MQTIYKHKRTSFIYISIVLCLFAFVKCINHETKKPNTEQVATSTPVKNLITYNQFAGSQVCSNCHKEITNNYFHSAHFYTSQPASEKTIKGSFKPGKNSFAYDENRMVKLEKRDSGLYEVYYYKGEQHVIRKFDIVVGSGIKGQTYLSWVGNQLIELPVSYFTQVHQWANSPGYPLYPTLFNRPATTRCLECHSTFATTLTPPMQEPEKFDSAKMILNVGCEKCHGPAAKHVAFETQHPNDTVGMFIINPAKLSRQLSIDVCALCHSGRLQKTQPSFQFVAGDTLSNYFLMNAKAQNINMIDVHGNQLGLLQASKCFQLSKTMTCITCHDSHKNEREKTELFSQRCMSCHTEQHKAIAGISNNNLIKNCINCHMPLQTSRSISFLLQGKTEPVNATMRTHYITVYNNETKKFIERQKKKL